MTKYHWQQRYALDRFDLEGPMCRLIGWIVGSPNKSVVDQRISNDLGYASHYLVKSESGEKIAWTWKIWWAELDEKGFYKPDSLTDGVIYSKMDDAKVALQERFGINPDEVTTVKWRGNLTEYN
jgi:hypothetical protein